MSDASRPPGIAPGGTSRPPSLVSHPAETVFGSLAAAEAQVHGVPIDEIHFHEVGALDAIADIVAVTTLWERLQPSVVVVSPVCVGSGSVRTAHGELSVPVPAVVQLLRGAPTFAGNTAHEACTPTGAALLHFMATAWGYQPLMTVDRIGVGAGGRDLPERPNVLRVLAGQSADQPASERLVVLSRRPSMISTPACTQMSWPARNRQARWSRG